MISQFTDRGIYSMVIPNGIHVPEYAVTLMVDGKGPDKVIFVADESPLIGAPVPTKRTCGDAISRYDLTTRGECDRMT